MGILSIGPWNIQRRTTIKPQREHINSDNTTFNVGNIDEWSNNNRSRNKFLRFIKPWYRFRLHDNNSRRGVQFRANVSRTRDDQSNNHPKNNRNKKCHRHNFNLYPIAALCLSNLAIAPVTLAEGVGGVSATANPIANSSGSVTNQAIQVLQGPYITNTYGGGVQCQGATFNLTPYLQFADSRKDPWEDFYDEPQYNLTDVEGKTVKQTVTVKNYPWESWYDTRTKDDGTRWFEDGESIEIEIDVDAPDGVPDVVGNGGSMTPTWYKPIRTDMKANQSFNAGLSATLSIPLNRKLQKQCHQAANAQIEMASQLVANKRLDFEIARLKNCGELKKAGIFFHPNSPYYAVCADVVVTTPGGKILPHEHELPELKFTPPSTSSQLLQQHSLPSASTDVPDETKQEVSSLGLSLSPSQSTSSLQASPPSKANPLGVLQVGQMSSPQ